MAKSTIDRILQPVHNFINRQFTGGIVLFASVVIAIAWANYGNAESYHRFWNTQLMVGMANHVFSASLHSWINDGLMALFFFVIGLELKREFMAGELSTLRKAILPMFAALGGMIAPALIYAFFNYGKISESGWGIPMATDIAFALALLSLGGKNIPSAVKVFLCALAVADDLGAVIVIALFYTTHIIWMPLLVAFFLLIVLALGNYVGVRAPVFYLLIGIAFWGCFLMSGIHATIAGVLVAMTIPARPKINEDDYLFSVRQNTDQFENAQRLDGSLITSEQLDILAQVKQLSLDAETPLQKIENALHPWVAFIIMPAFALANAGMTLESDFFRSLANPVSIGIMTGLIVGKCIGVFGFAWVLIRLKLSTLPLGANWWHMFGVSILAGVGFTMSLFITELAFKNQTQLIDQSKYGILLASTIAATIGVFVLRTISPQQKLN